MSIRHAGIINPYSNKAKEKVESELLGKKEEPKEGSAPAIWKGDGTEALETQWEGVSSKVSCSQTLTKTKVTENETAINGGKSGFRLLTTGATAELFSKKRCIHFYMEAGDKSCYSGRCELTQGNPYSSTNSLVTPKDRRFYNSIEFWLAFQAYFPYTATERFPLNSEVAQGSEMMQIHRTSNGKSPFGLSVGRASSNHGAGTPHAGGPEKGWLQLNYINSSNVYTNPIVNEDVKANKLYNFLLRYFATTGTTGNWTFYFAEAGKPLVETYARSGLKTIQPDESGSPKEPNFSTIGLYPDTAVAPPAPGYGLYLGGYNIANSRENATINAFGSSL